MRYVERASFEGTGIQELSFDGIAFVCGGGETDEIVVTARRKEKVEKNPNTSGGSGSYYSTPINIAGSRTYPKADRCAVADNMSNGGNVLQGVGAALAATPGAPAAPFVGGFGTGLAAVGGALHFINGCGK